MNKYELMLVFDEDELAFENAKDSVKETLKSNGMSISDEKDMGMRDLAYEINRKKKGHYLLLVIESQPHAIKEVQKVFKIAKYLMRYIFVKLEG